MHSTTFRPRAFAPRWNRLSAALLLGGALFAAQAGTLGVFTSDDKGFDTHTFYYDDGQEVVIIDTQFVPALTQKMVEQIRRHTRSTITRVVVTHPNPDKFNGLAYLHAQGVHSISSRAVADAIPAVHAYKTRFWVNTMQAFKPGAYPKLENVQEHFDGASKTLRLKSGETLTLFALKNPGVAAHQVVVRVDATGDLIVGDLVHHQAHAWLEGGLRDERPAPSIEGWMAALDELPPLSAGKSNAKVYGGRGEFAPVNEAVHTQKDYLARVARITNDHMSEVSHCRATLGSPDDANAQYGALEKKISAAFPGYKLPYMVRYSVYGLANQKAREACANSQINARAKVRVEHDFNQPADTVWRTLGRFCGISDWQSVVSSCVTEERRDGFYRVIVMKDNSAYTERLEQFSHPDRAFQYAIVSGPLPVTGYQSRFEIVPMSGQRSRLIWQAWYDQPKQNASEVARNIEMLYRNGIQGMTPLLAQAR